MGKWNIIHKVRYPPFDHQRWKPSIVPIVNEKVKMNLTNEQIKQSYPPFRINSEEGWLLERTIVSEDGIEWDGTTSNFVDNSEFVNLVDQQRKGWYIIPNNLP